MRRMKRGIGLSRLMMIKGRVLLMSIFVWWFFANFAIGNVLHSASFIPLAIGKAETYVGTSYKWGGNDYDGIDCSGLIKKILEFLGIYVPRNSRAQADYWQGEDISCISDLQPGDLVFFMGRDGRVNHVGMVVSTESGAVVFIHASSDNGCVAKNKLEGKWARKFVKGKRLFETINPKAGTQSHIQGSITTVSQSFSKSSWTHREQSSPQPSKADTRSYTPKSPLGSYPEASQRHLTDGELSKLSKWQLRVLRNSIFARHGYEFHLNSRVISYFRQQEWYNKVKPKTRNSSYIYGSCMSEVERENIRRIQIYEGR